MEYDFSYLGIDLVQTCGGCPEAYNAYSNGIYIGYLRLRHGTFTVDYEVNGADPELIWEVHPTGDGIFVADERQRYLETACLLLSVAHQ